MRIFVLLILYLVVAILDYMYFTWKRYYDTANCRFVLFKKRNRILLAIFWPLSLIYFIIGDLCWLKK